MTPYSELSKNLLALRRTPEDVAASARRIHDATLLGARHIKAGNFDVIGGDDVEMLFDLTDREAFGGDLRKLVGLARCSLSFHISSRLTSSGGTTKQFRPRGARPGPFLAGCRYEITLSSTLLFQTFRDVDRPVRVTGHLCADRLEAAQRVMEHEMVHLLEMLAAGKSSCAKPPFQAIASAVFGHTEHKHNLVTQRERAKEIHGLKVGDAVTFMMEGRKLVGLLNRVTKRATVLVEDAKGQLYTSGKRYLKYYVPLGLLTPLNGGSAASPS